MSYTNELQHCIPHMYPLGTLFLSDDVILRRHRLMLESGKAMEFLEFLVLRCDVQLLPELNRRALRARCMVFVLFKR